jgi:hypothetical protein
MSVRNETEAWIALQATARRNVWNGDVEASVGALVGQVAEDGQPYGKNLRRPRLQVVHPITTVDAPLTRDDVVPGMRMVDGRWFYSARWL